MTDWVRLWHDMPTDPKWRVVARKSGQPISAVIAVYTFALVNASANATERGRTHNLNAEDIAAALDMEEGEIEAILLAMQGKVLDGDRLAGWEKRQPIREDGAAERAKAWRERNRTQKNAPERPDAETDTDKKGTPLPPDGGFERFWKLYPHAVEEEAARIAFAKAILVADAETILAGVEVYRDAKPPTQAWKKPAGWLDKQRWKDRPAGIAPSKVLTFRAASPTSTVCSYDEMKAKQARDGGGLSPISAIADTVRMAIEGEIS